MGLLLAAVRCSLGQGQRGPVLAQIGADGDPSPDAQPVADHSPLLRGVRHLRAVRGGFGRLLVVPLSSLLSFGIFHASSRSGGSWAAGLSLQVCGWAARRRRNGRAPGGLRAVSCPAFPPPLLRDAVHTVLDYEQRWAAYSKTEGEPEVIPVLVIQVPDKANSEKLGEIVQTVEAECPMLGSDAVAHVFGEHEPVVLASRTVHWVYPESIQGDTTIRVVLAKEAISTGWDCPRAEVLYSERPAKDSTHIAQVIGRMVRQPLTHRIATDDVLNTVSCYLPLFDRNALASIKEALEGTGKENGDAQVGPEVLLAHRNFGWNPNVLNDVFEFIETLPSIPTPDATVSPLRRAKRLVQLLSDDASGMALLPDAGDLLMKTLYARLDGLRAEYKEVVATRVAEFKTVEVRREVVPPGGQADRQKLKQRYAGYEHTPKISTATLVLQRQFREGCGVMPAWRRGAWHGSVWPVRYCPAYPQATAATRLARTVPGAAFPAPPGRPAAS